MSDERWIKEENQCPKVPLKKSFFNRQKWESRQAPGTPPGFEALFEMMKANKTEGASFKYARYVYKNLTDDQIWAAFELWMDHKVHPIVRAEMEPEVKKISSQSPIQNQANDTKLE